eukprot:COSAG02_NODE_11459_length_1720_cov_1.565083_1_plen_25_part_10
MLKLSHTLSMRSTSPFFCLALYFFF